MRHPTNFGSVLKRIQSFGYDMSTMCSFLNFSTKFNHIHNTNAGTIEFVVETLVVSSESPSFPPYHLLFSYRYVFLTPRTIVGAPKIVRWKGYRVYARPLWLCVCVCFSLFLMYMHFMLNLGIYKKLNAFLLNVYRTSDQLISIIT